MTKKLSFAVRTKINKDVIFQDFLIINLDVEIDIDILANYITEKINLIFPDHKYKLTSDILNEIFICNEKYIGCEGFLSSYNKLCIYAYITN